MNDLVKTLNCLPSMNRIERKPLYACLGMIGAKPVRQTRGFGFPAHPRPGSGFHHLTQWELHDLSTECHKLWIEGCKVIQTHLIENHDAAAKWNALWARLEELFKRKGVEMA
jgi:hypothetical protein